MSKARISFILCNTRFASNLGSAARVLENFGFRNLLLVSPACEVGAEARTFAMKGSGLLDEARIVPDLATAARSVDFLIGSSARSSRRGVPALEAPDLAAEILFPYSSHHLGIVFGSEKNGLSRQELALCHWIVTIPTNSGYGSLNLAQAVAILAYQLHLGLTIPGPVAETGDGGVAPFAEPATPPAAAVNAPPAAHLEVLMASIRDCLDRMELPAPLSRQRILKRLAKIAGRARLDRHDVNLLQGLLRRGGSKPE